MQEGKNSQNRFIKFVQATLEDFAGSGKSVTEFFHTNAKNKDLFRTKDYMIGNLGREARPEFGLITNYVFGRMFREFHLRRLHRYMPHKDGEKLVFGKHTNKLVMLLALNMFDEIRAKELGATKEELDGRPSEAQIRTSQLEAQKRLQAAGFKFSGSKAQGQNAGENGMKYNSQTGLIEGQVINKNGETLTALIDPSNPESIIFDGANGKEFLSLSDEQNLKAVASLTIDERLRLSAELEIPGQLDLTQTQAQSQDLELSLGTKPQQKGFQGLEIFENQEWLGEEGGEIGIEGEESAFKRTTNNQNTPIKKGRMISPSLRQIEPITDIDQYSQNDTQEERTGRYSEDKLKEKEEKRILEQGKTPEEKRKMQAQNEEEKKKKAQKQNKKGSIGSKVAKAGLIFTGGALAVGTGTAILIQFT